MLQYRCDIRASRMFSNLQQTFTSFRTRLLVFPEETLKLFAKVELVLLTKNIEGNRTAACPVYVIIRFPAYETPSSNLEYCEELSFRTFFMYHIFIWSRIKPGKFSSVQLSIRSLEVNSSYSKRITCRNILIKGGQFRFQLYLIVTNRSLQ